MWCVYWEHLSPDVSKMKREQEQAEEDVINAITQFRPPLCLGAL